jgi:uncharacterized protein YbjT (DUF2867 family)
MQPHLEQHNEHSTADASKPLVFLTGATGYIGGRLLLSLEKQGHRLRCLARRPEYLESRVLPTTQVVGGDLLDRSSLDHVMEGVDTAYYLVHSMGTSNSFEEDDRVAASNFVHAARTASVRRIVYLGGLGDESEDLSPHLKSRQEVGDVLRQSGIPVVELRASIVIGSGSLSFEMIRSLVERLPIMITPKWVKAAAQPIFIGDVVEYLTEAMSLPTDDCKIYEIGGADQISYAGIMGVYAKARQMRLRMIPVPVLTPYLSSLWLGLVTPLYARVGRKLVESIVHSTVVRNSEALTKFRVQPIGIEEAVERALTNEDNEFAATRWSDSLSSSGQLISTDGMKFDTRLLDSRTTTVPRRTTVAFMPIAEIGGDTGWYAFNWMWRLRGFVDLLFGGVGTRRGRPALLRTGDTIDFWRVELFEPGRLLRLFAEMKLPGRAWLEFEVTGEGNSSTIRQTAVFDPVGFWGRLYWYALYPVHHLIFSRMLSGISRASITK